MYNSSAEDTLCDGNVNREGGAVKAPVEASQEYHRCVSFNIFLS